MERTVIALSAKRESMHEDGIYWWVEYAVRAATSEEQFHPYGGAFVLERRYQGGRTGIDENWHTLSGGPTPLDAALSTPESAYMRAETLHPLHKRVLERHRTYARRHAWKQRVAKLVDMLFDTQAAAQAEFHAELKRARLYGKALKNEAAPDKVQAIKTRVRAAWDARLERAAAISMAAKRAMNS